MSYLLIKKLISSRQWENIILIWFQTSKPTKILQTKPEIVFLFFKVQLFSLKKHHVTQKFISCLKHASYLNKKNIFGKKNILLTYRLTKRVLCPIRDHRSVQSVIKFDIVQIKSASCFCFQPNYKWQISLLSSI